MEPTNTSRKVVVIEGDYDACLNYAKTISQNLETLFLSDIKKANDYLGQEFDALIYDGFADFSPNAFGALIGTIRGDGYLLLIKPKAWHEKRLFLQRFDMLLRECSKVEYKTPVDNSISLPVPSRKIHTKPFASDDQKIAVEKIMHVVTGHRRRPLVITSDRGRGKSASLGIAAAQLIEQGYKNILVCAPSKKTAKVIFKHAEQDLPFFSPDELNQQLPEADCVLIDEAAAIPVPLLTRFLKHYSRIVFASTEHGYEGSGRGFSTSFRKVLDHVSPEWKSCQLTTPIRWDKNDALEAFVFDALLLNAEPVEANLIHSTHVADCTFSKLEKRRLINNQPQLQELFGLLVNAHYQTKPSDFKQLLDDESLDIFTLSVKSHIVAVCLSIKEGGIDAQLAQSIFEGTRRIKGHLIAQALAANIGIESAPQLTGERIMRIAVHPALEDKGFGSRLLEDISQQSQADYLSTSFGATESLIPFWKKNNYVPVYLSMKRDASSGTHSLIMLKGKNEKGHALLENAKAQFEKSFLHLLSDPFKTLETEIALLLLEPKEPVTFDESNEKIIRAFAYQQRGYENSLLPIWKLVVSSAESLKTLKANEREVILIKVIQKNTWQETVGKLNGKVSGKKDALKLLRQAVTALLIQNQ